MGDFMEAFTISIFVHMVCMYVCMLLLLLYIICVLCYVTFVYNGCYFCEQMIYKGFFGIMADFCGCNCK